jgi:hypothetical protein
LKLLIHFPPTSSPSTSSPPTPSPPTPNQPLANSNAPLPGYRDLAPAYVVPTKHTPSPKRNTLKRAPPTAPPSALPAPTAPALHLSCTISRKTSRSATEEEDSPVAERSASGYRIAPSHLIFMEPTRFRVAARFSVTSPLAVKPRRRRAWRSHGRHRVRIRSTCAAAVSLPLLGAAARIRAGRSYGRHRARQRSSRVDALFLFAVASLNRARHRSRHVAVASLKPLGAAAAIHFPAVSCFLRVFYVLPKSEAGRWLFLKDSAVPEGRLLHRHH